MKTPFPYFGGKSTIAHKVWAAIGDCKHYLEPFFGSGAVLLSRPKYNSGKDIETVCDKDGFLCNVWRALQHNPDEVAKWCDWPVNHADLAARKKELIKNELLLLENLINNPDWYDAKLAGYWIWAASCWIGSGLTRVGSIPHVGDGGLGVHALGKSPHVGHGGMGVHALGQRPDVSNGGMGVQETYNTNIYTWFRQLSERLRYVRVVCGDWTRICGGNWQDETGICGIFFDPPYGVTDRDANLYHCDSTHMAKDVLNWCKDRGKINTYRIVIAGYEEHTELLKEGWTSEAWSAQGGYSNLGKKKENNNKHREILYYSPYCINQIQKGLFV